MPQETHQASSSPPSVIVPQPGNFAFLFKETENPDGGAPRTLSFSNVQIRPCAYEQLAQARLHENVTIPLDMINGTLLDTDVEGVDPSAYVNVKAVLESPFTAQAIGLVRGGWLPSPLAATRRNAVILPDRNIVTEIIGRFRDGQLSGRKRDFLDLFHDAPVRINPMLFALEGNGRAIPDAALAQAQLAEATAKLRIAALAWSALAWVSVTFTSQPAFLAASVAPLITAMLSASLASRATMPRVLASAAAGLPTTAHVRASVDMAAVRNFFMLAILPIGRCLPGAWRPFGTFLRVAPCGASQPAAG